MDTWNKVCRACLTTKETFTYFLFKNVSPETYWFCTSVQVCKDDKLPNALCSSCTQLITKYSDFKRTCIESQNTLLNCIKTNKEKEAPLESDANYPLVHVVLQNGNSREMEYNVTVKEEEVSDQHNDDLSAAVVEFSDDTIDNKVSIHKRKKLKRDRTKSKVQRKGEKKSFKFSCDLCLKKFRKHTSFEAHKLEHEGRKASYQCAPCNKTYATWSGMKRHDESAHAAVRLQQLICSSCGRVCKSRQTLRAHERSAHGQRACDVVCHVCGRRVSSALILQTHLETHKANRERRHTCEHCGKKFFTNTTLTSHIGRQHTGKRYICEYCNYPFTDKHNLAKHILRHNGIKLYKCDICSKSYATSGSLVEHKRIHSGERPYSCSYCPKRFLSKKRLTEHHRTHTGEKPHKCDVCEQRFTQRGTLQRHMKVHDKTVVIVPN